MSADLVLLFILSALLVASTFAVTRVKDLFALVVLMSIFSAVVALLYTLVRAVDVAFTEAVVGTGVSTVFLVLLLRRIDPYKISRATKQRRMFAAVVIGALALVLTYGIWALPDFAAQDAVANQHISPDYLDLAYPEMKTPNVVTATLADFRSIDTLVEAAVVVTAAVACSLILGRVGYRRRDESATTVEGDAG